MRCFPHFSLFFLSLLGTGNLFQVLRPPSSLSILSPSFLPSPSLLTFPSVRRTPLNNLRPPRHRHDPPLSPPLPPSSYFHLTTSPNVLPSPLLALLAPLQHPCHFFPTNQIPSHNASGLKFFILLLFFNRHNVACPTSTATYFSITL